MSDQEFSKRWYRIMNKGSELNRDCPWIYSDHWYSLFAAEMLSAWEDGNVEILNTWEEEFHMN